MGNSAEKSKQLGMSFGTASNQLRKHIMFQLVQQAGRDICFQCGDKIDHVDNLSIEHKTPWLHTENPNELFFDLNNIAFSHLKCNTTSRRKTITTGPSGYKGVSYSPRKGYKNPWKVLISIEGKRKEVGRFPTAEEAALAYDKRAIELFGDDVVTNRKLGLV